MLHVGSFQWLLLCLVWQPLWISEISKEVSGGAGHLSSSRGNKSLTLTFVMEKCVSHIKNKIKSSLCSQDPHLSQAESYSDLRLTERRLYFLLSEVWTRRALRETPLLNQPGWHAHLKDSAHGENMPYDLIITSPDTSALCYIPDTQCMQQTTHQERTSKGICSVSTDLIVTRYMW